MKEALSKRLILGRLVNASRLKAGNADTPRALKHQWKWQPTGVHTMRLITKNWVVGVGLETTFS